MSFNYYFAGGLFSHKEIIGNHLLADAVFKYSDGEFNAFLPQKAENQLRPSPLEIRDNDFKMLLESQLALFNFDGSDLDSGTVAEFMVARFLDIPCLLFRTDFRAAGDQNADGEPWNLMCSGYPRTLVCCPDYTMSHYQKLFSQTKVSISSALEAYYKKLSGDIIRGFRELLEMPPQLKTPEEACRVYRHFVESCGGTLPEQFDEKRLRKIVALKKWS